MGRRSAVAGAVAVAVGVTLLATAGVVRWRAADDGPLSEDEAEAIVSDYLDAIEREDYRAAAQLSVGETAAGLADHCRNGCLASTGVAVDVDGGRYVAVVTFGEPRGHPLERSFVIEEDDEGQASVQGLPPAGTGTLPRP